MNTASLAGAIGCLFVVACAANDALDAEDVNATAGTVNVVGLSGEAGAGGTRSTGSARAPGPDGDEVTVFAAWSPMMPPLEYRALYAAWSNQSDHSIFVEPQCAADWWRREGGGWDLDAERVTVCPNSDGQLVELLPGRTLLANTSFDLAAGIYQLRGNYSVGCRVGGDCSASYSRTSRDVWVVVSAGESAADAGTVTAPGHLHASCGAEAPCPVGETAIADLGNENRCSCEIPCEPSSSTAACPAGTKCTFVSDGLGSVCR
jgi:hypothetical protein